MANQEQATLALKNPHVIFEGDSFTLWTNQSGQFWNNTYVIVDRESGVLALVDPLDDCLENWSVFLEEQNRPLDSILITHAHIDHVAGVAQLLNAYPGVKIYAHADGVPLMKAEDIPMLTGGIETLEQYANQFSLPMYQPAESTDSLSEGDSIHIGKTTFEILYTPGHCPGHIAFQNRMTLISGDVIYKGSVGFTHIPGSDADVLADTILDKFMVLSDEVVIYPGHGNTTTIGDERATNPFIVEALGESS